LNTDDPPLLVAHAGAGSCELRAYLPPSAQRHVFCFEHIRNPADLARAGNALIMTSRYESPCYAALEGLAAGLKIFLTKSPGFVGQMKLGFREIEWIDNGASQHMLARNITAALQHWIDAGFPMPADSQVRLARNWFDGQTQLEKTLRLYDRLASTEKRHAPRPRHRMRWEPATRRH